MDPQDISDEPTSGMDRRTLIRGAGVVGAALWGAPVITSFTSAAHAAGSVQPTCGTECNACFQNNVAAPCGAGDCLCSRDVDGLCRCSANVFGSGPCTQSSDCQPNEFCVTIASNGCDAADKFCLPACGTTGAAASVDGRRPGDRPA